MEEGRRILVVDDACDLRVYLEMHDYIVLQAASAKEAVAKVRTALPDLVVLVVMTPGMDGIEILHVVRSISTVPIIMVTAKGEEDDKVRALRLGADDKEAPMSTYIAVIDDDPACRDLLHDLLSEEGYAVRLFPDRATAARCLRELAPAAIILDLRLENPTAGWEVLADLRHDPVLHTTPVLVCSADLSALQERAADLERQGCTMLAKPFDVDELLVRLQQLARGAPSASPAATGAGRGTPVCAGD